MQQPSKAKGWFSERDVNKVVCSPRLPLEQRRRQARYQEGIVPHLRQVYIFAMKWSEMPDFQDSLQPARPLQRNGEYLVFTKYEWSLNDLGVFEFIEAWEESEVGVCKDILESLCYSKWLNS